MAFSKTAKQIEATKKLATASQVMLYGGSRSGKTFHNLRTIILRASKVKSRHLVARFRFNHVKQSIVYDTLPKVLELCFPTLRCELNKSDWFLTLPNGSEIWFGGLDDKERVDKVLGNEYSTIFLNECTQISWDARNTVMSRLAENVGLRQVALYDCNPTSRKHWTYTVFKEGKSPDGEPIKNFDSLYANLQMNPTDNMANLSQNYIDLLESLPKRQRERFLKGEFQDDLEGALWNFLLIEQAKGKIEREIKKTIIAVDPAITNNEDSDLTGIVACGLDIMNEGVVIEDASIKASPNEWANRVVNMYRKHEAAYVVVEVNQGGDMVESMIHNIDRSIKVVKVRASKGKFARAEPVAALYERGLIRHCDGLDELESEMCEYVPLNSKKSPDRLDACLIGQTLIKTFNGDVEIKNVKVGDYVLTRKGYRKVLASELTVKKSKTFDVLFSDGTVLTGTGNHPIYIKSKGFVNIDALVYGDIISNIKENKCQKEKMPPSLLNMTVKNGKDILNQKINQNEDTTLLSMGKILKHYIGMFMRKISVKFQKVFMFIISMVTFLTTIQKILPQFRPKNIQNSTRKNFTNREKITLNPYALLRLNGMAVKKGLSSISGLAKSLGRIVSQNLRATVNLVASIFTLLKMQIFAVENAIENKVIKKKDTITLSSVPFAQKIFGGQSIEKHQQPAPVYVVQVTENQKTDDVYNLEVEYEHEYYANGVLVHNCVWGMTDLLVKESKSFFMA